MSQYSEPYIRIFTEGAKNFSMKQYEKRDQAPQISYNSIANTIILG